MRASTRGGGIGECIMSSRTCLGIFRRLRDLHRDRRGNVAVMMGFLLAPLIGTFGVGFEVGNWYLITRSAQNAADSAALAAATNGSTGWDIEAKAVAAQYGFADGVNNVTVTASNAAACPGGGNTCYSVTITKTVSLFVSQVIGYTGNATLDGAAAQQLTSTAVATQSTIQVPLCLLALGKSGAQDIVTNGNPKANMTDCSVMANTSATCNGSNLGAPYGLAHGKNDGCGVIQVSGVPQVTDPYASLATKIPTNTCGTSVSNYPQETKKGPVNWTQWSTGTKSLSGNVKICGDLQLTGNVTIDAPGAGATLVIYGGQLDTNGYTLQTSSGSGLTVVFANPTGCCSDGTVSSNNYPTDNSGGSKGVIDIAAPTSGDWSGMAIYQDPNLTSGVDVSSAGNSPTWDISGAVYLPNSNVTISGAINKSSNGSNCFVMVMDQVTINGTGDLLAGDTAAGCAAAGLNTPKATVPTRGQLVY